MRKYSCSGPQVVTTRVAVDPNSFSTRTACLESASIERNSGVFLSSASPVQLTNAVGITSVEPLGLSKMTAGVGGGQAQVPPGFAEGRVAPAGKEIPSRSPPAHYLPAKPPTAGPGAD